MQYRTHKTVLAGLIGLVLAGAASFASAQPSTDSNDVPSMIVSYRDLNINEPAGAKALLGRIGHAARTVCEPFRYDDAPFGSQGYAGCVRRSIERAVAKLGNPTVDALANPQSARTTRVALGSR
jgi:UrcA family protein